MRLLGAECSAGGRELHLVDRISSELSAVELRWVHTPNGKRARVLCARTRW
jgi:hypothetical protein